MIRAASDDEKHDDMVATNYDDNAEDDDNDNDVLFGTDAATATDVDNSVHCRDTSKESNSNSSSSDDDNDEDDDTTSEEAADRQNLVEQSAAVDIDGGGERWRTATPDNFNTSTTEYIYNNNIIMMDMPSNMNACNIGSGSTATDSLLGVNDYAAVNGGGVEIDDAAAAAAAEFVNGMAHEISRFEEQLMREFGEVLGGSGGK
jgi:hypothetical protein